MKAQKAIKQARLFPGGGLILPPARGGATIGERLPAGTRAALQPKGPPWVTVELRDLAYRLERDHHPDRAARWAWRQVMATDPGQLGYRWVGRHHVVSIIKVKIHDLRLSVWIVSGVRHNGRVGRVSPVCSEVLWSREELRDYLRALSGGWRRARAYQRTKYRRPFCGADAVLDEVDPAPEGGGASPNK